MSSDDPDIFRRVELTPEQLRNLRPGPIKHNSLPPELQDAVAWTFKLVGHHIQPTFEQWEIGFMRDRWPDAEIRVWCRIALAFERYHRERGLPLREDGQERELIARLVEVSTGFEPDDEEGRDIRECYLHPDQSGTKAPPAAY
jgi:hypothetical protein